jgi:hypothetical protein
MRRSFLAGLCIFSLFAAREAAATGEAARYYCVELSAQVSTSPPTIQLNWPFYTNATSFTVYRRNPGDTSWGSGTSLGSGTVSYVDADVSVGSAYEYRVSRSGGISGNGYVYAGIEPPPIEDRGKVILLVDTTTASTLPAELARLQMDLVGDGWTVLRHDIPRTMAVTNVKAIVKADYDADTSNVKSLFVFGRVPVPFSGNLNPDRHGARAFPTDLYYAELYGTTWTDTSISNTTWDDHANWNVPGDGKYDQSYLSSTPELESGRVDLYNMPVFTNWTEQALLQRYLNKDHAFRQAQMNIQRRGLVYDSWDLTTAQEGWRNFAPFFGPTNVVSQWWWTMDTTSYLWSYSCGYGDGQTDPRANFATRPLNTVFTMRFGSWSGDWEDADNVMRCILASSPSGLTCSWAGYGYLGNAWYYHPMGLGRTIGHSARYTQAAAISAPAYFELIGDPTLRMHPVMPPTAPTTTLSGSDVVVQWGASPDTAIRGYHVYRSASPTSNYIRVNGALLTGTTYADSSAPAGTNYYMVRAVKLETSASGTYLNPSQGVFTRHPGAALKLVVVSPYGTSLPPVNTNAYGYATDLTPALLTPTVTQGTTRYVCTGWTGTGSVPASGTGTNLPLILLTEDSTLTWQWTTNYWLDVVIDGAGTVDVASGWFAAGSTVTLTASANPPMRFMQWPGNGARNPLVLTMDQARQVTASFAPIAATTNALPFIASFENYPADFMLPGTDGWAAARLDCALVSTNPAVISALTNFTAACGFPLPATNHAQVMQTTGSILTNQFSMPTGQIVWLDMLVAFDPWEEQVTPPADPDVQWSLFARTSGHLMLWHADLEQGSNVWTELAQTVETGRWYRLTVKMDYSTADTNHGAHYYQIDLDGHTLSDASAYTLNDGSGVTGGTWFAAAYSASEFSQLILGGTGFFDDMVVSTNNPHNRLAPLGTPEWWLVNYGLTNAPADEEQADSDKDGLLNSQEFVAGTDPRNKSSVFQIRDLGGMNGASLPVQFDSVAGRIYAIYSATNLVSNDWQPCEYSTTLNGSLQSDPLSSTGGLMTIFVEPPASARYYRLNVTR